MPSIINIAQFAFVKGRQIGKNILMAQELFRGYGRASGTPKWALTVDLFKAFDSLDWNFIVATLHRINFPDMFVKWVFACISSTHFSIKVNGALHGYFIVAKGLHQGDPMSPYLFFIAMNILSCMLNNISDNFNFYWKCEELGLSHLFYADDGLLFARATKDSILHIMNCMTFFSCMSGLKPSAHKSTVFFAMQMTT